jgi:hypothetical protein
MDFARLNHILGYDQLSLEEKVRRAVRAAKFEERESRLWLRIVPTIPEGVSTTRASELFMLARNMILTQERATAASEEEAQRITGQRLLASNDY